MVGTLPSYLIVAHVMIVPVALVWVISLQLQKCQK